MHREYDGSCIRVHRGVRVIPSGVSCPVVFLLSRLAAEILPSFLCTASIYAHSDNRLSGELLKHSDSSRGIPIGFSIDLPLKWSTSIAR